MKKTICWILSMILLISLCACGASDSSDADEQATKAPTTNAPTTEATTQGATQPPLSPEEQELADNLAFLSSVTYQGYELTGNNTPYFMGRWFEKNIRGTSHMITLTAGSTAYFMTNNTSTIKVNFTAIIPNESLYFAYSIDGGSPVRQEISNPLISLPNSSRHTIRIVADGLTESVGKWTAEQGFAFRNVEVAPGGSIYGIKPTGKVIFYYGDSITEGVNALADGSLGSGNSAVGAYPWFCSESLGAVSYTVGYGASGIIKEGSFQTMLKAIDYLSMRTKVNDGIVPDVIVINHGTNDKAVPENEFRTALRATLARLREKYPDAPIVYLIPLHQAQVAAITAEMELVENGYVVPTANWNLTYTDTVHPNPAGAKVAGQKLALALRQILGKDFFG